MKRPAQDILFTVIMMAVTGVLCFSFGLFAAWKFGWAEQRVLIEYEVTEPSETTTTTAAEYKIDLNSATVEDLVQVDGIGEKTAEKIIAYRTEHGAFKSVDDLLNISGIGEKKLEQMKPYLKVEAN